MDKSEKDSLSAEIKEAVEAITKPVAPVEDKKDDNVVPKKDIPSGEDLPDDEPSEDVISDKGNDDEGKADDAGDDVNTISDELLERAVKSGLSLSEARKFPNSELLESMIDRLGAGKGEPKKPDEVTEEEDPFASIPDLDPEEYDENLVNGFKMMKDLAKKQAAKIKELESVGKKAAAENFFDSKVAGLGENFVAALKSDVKKQTALRKQFDVLTAGYKATGETVSPDAVFEQAVSTIMGDIISKSKEVKKEERLRSRQGQFISRPGNAKTAPKGDVRDEIAEKINEKFYKKS